MKRLVLMLLTFTSAIAADCIPRVSIEAKIEPSALHRFRIFSRLINQIGEPCLQDTVAETRPQEVYRFIWTGSIHNLNFVSVRVEVAADDSALVFFKHIARGPIAGSLPPDGQVTISKEQVQSLRKQMKKFWRLEAFREDSGSDGSNWYLEAIDGGKYHFVHRWAPGRRDKKVKQLGFMFLYDIAKLQVDRDYIGGD